MIYFITTRKYNVNSQFITIEDNLDHLNSYLSSLEVIGLDKEFTKINEFYAVPLLTVLGDQHNQFVVDDLCYTRLDYLEPFKHKLFIGHNIKIDIKIARRQGVDIRNVYDTMVVEQRLGLGSGRLNNLKDSYERRCGKMFPQSKDTREEFANKDASFMFENRHIEYAANDVFTLFELREKQKAYIDKFDIRFLIEKIELPLIPILADMELEGFTLDKEKWKQNIEANKKKMFELECQMDEELMNAGLIEKKFRLERHKIEVNQFDIFGGSSIKEAPNKAKINYSSPKQILELFDKLKIERPTIVTKRKEGYKKVYEEKDSVGIGALNLYLNDNSHTILNEFIRLLLFYKEVDKKLNSFGERFINYSIGKGSTTKIGYLNKITNKIHTIYRQCMTSTGRLASGDEEHGYYNSQQIPKSNDYRNCFTLTQEEIDNDWWITSSDLVGAETIIMCAFAKDANLYKWAVEEDDLHSPMATLCWRAIFANKASKVKDKESEKYKKLLELSKTYEVSKKVNKNIRDAFKSVTFGVVYGAKATTVAKTINISEEEAQIVIDIIKNKIPETFKMVERATLECHQTGKVLHNTRTNSRRWFPRMFSDPSKEEMSMAGSEARNTRIQGTQSDMIKEAMVEIDRYFRDNNLEGQMLLQVHDEIVMKHKGKDNSKHVERIMGEVATRYLEGFTEMKADAHVARCWVK